MLLDDGGLAISYDFSALPVPENKIISIITPNINYGPKDVYIKINNNTVSKEIITFKNTEAYGLPEGFSVNLDGLELPQDEPMQLSVMISASTFLEKGFESCDWGYKSDLDYDPCDEYFRLTHYMFFVENIDFSETKINMSMCAPYGVLEEDILYEVPEEVLSYSSPKYKNIGTENYLDDDKRFCLNWIAVEDGNDPGEFTLLLPAKAILAANDDFSNRRRQ